MNEQNVFVTPKKSRGVLKAILIVLLLIIALVGGFFIGKSMTKESKNTNKENKITSVKLGDEETNKLLSYLPKIKLSHEDYSVYQSKAVTSEMVDSDILFANVVSHVKNKEQCTIELFNLNGLCDFVIKVEDAKKIIKDRYGDINVRTPLSIEGGGLLACTLSNDKFACSNSGGDWLTTEYTDYFDLVFNSKFDGSVTEVLKTEKDDNYLYIYEKYIYYKFDKLKTDDEYENIDNYKFKIYKYSDSNELLNNNYLNGKDFYKDNSTFKDELFKYVGDKYTTYKHTYKINNDENYTWFKTEPLK